MHWNLEELQKATVSLVVSFSRWMNFRGILCMGFVLKLVDAFRFFFIKVGQKYRTLDVMVRVHF